MQTRVSSKGQVVLPVALRQRLGIRAGDALDISIEQDRIVLKPPVRPKHEARIVRAFSI
jgi:AbrB family looped-hinge helix DNA binding protein